MTSAYVGRFLDGYSLEATSNDMPALERATGRFAPGSVISIPFLPDESAAARVSAAVAIRRLGFVPMPHIAARRIGSAAELGDFLARVSGEAGVDRLLVIAGDCDTGDGPFDDALALLRSEMLPAHGIRTVGISGYPEGHPKIDADRLGFALHAKLATLAEQGMDCEIATQFAFDADPVIDWLAALRRDGVHVPVRIGIPGPASVKTLLRFAALCGVAASAKVMAKYGLSLTRLLTTTGPDKLVDGIAGKISPALHGDVRAHFYPFGGLARTADWIGGQLEGADLRHAC